MSSDEGSLLSATKECMQTLQNIAKVYAPAQEWINRLDSCYIELKDLSHDIAGMICGRDNVREGGIPSSARLGERKFITYLVALTLVHHAVFFSLEALSWTHALHTLLRIVVSTAVSAGFIWIIARIFTAKIPVRI